MEYLNAFSVSAEQTQGAMGEECEGFAAENHAAHEPGGVKPQRSCTVLSVLVMIRPPVN